MADMRFNTCLALCLGVFFQAQAAPPPQLSAPEYMAGVKAAKPKGGVYLRARLEQGKSVLQIQIKRRNLPDGGSDQLYQVLFPKDRKGEALLIHTTKKGFTGSLFTPGGSVRPINSGDRRQSIFGTDLTIEDLQSDFLDWKQQSITGHETLGGHPCVVIESKPDHPGNGPSKVVSWIDEKRYVPIRVQVFDGGDKPARIVDTEKVLPGSSGYYIPVTFAITNTSTSTRTNVEGSSSKDGINFSDADFTEQAMQQVTPPPKEH